MPTLEAADPRKIFAMLKGEPGVRKSTAALSFPGKQFWFNWDRKIEGILIPAKNWGIDLKKIEYEDYDNWNTPRQKLESFITNCPYDTLVFDSITSCADMTLRQTRRSKGADKGKMIGGIKVDDIEDFNAESSALNELISLCKDVQSNHFLRGRVINIILIAHVMEVTKVSIDNKVNITRTIVTAGKRVAAKIPAYCSEVYHFGIKRGISQTEGGKYVVLTEGTGDDFARTALPLPKEFEMGDKQLYKEFMLPAINEMLKSQGKQPYDPYTQTTENKPNFNTK